MENALLKEDTFVDELLEQDTSPFLLPFAAAKGTSGPRDKEECAQDEFSGDPWASDSWFRLR